MSDVDWDNIKADPCNGACSINMNDGEKVDIPIEKAFVKPTCDLSSLSTRGYKMFSFHNDKKLKYELVDKSMPTLQIATEGSVGIDLYNRLDETIPPFAMGYKIPLNVKFEMQYELWLMLAARSSFAMKYGLLVSNGFGTIDVDFHDEVCLLVYNPTSEIKKIPKGTRIAQVIPMPTCNPNLTRVDHIDDDGSHLGFGSTGK